MAITGSMWQLRDLRDNPSSKPAFIVISNVDSMIETRYLIWQLRGLYGNYGINVAVTGCT